MTGLALTERGTSYCALTFVRIYIYRSMVLLFRADRGV